MFPAVMDGNSSCSTIGSVNSEGYYLLYYKGTCVESGGGTGVMNKTDSYYCGIGRQDLADERKTE